MTLSAEHNHHDRHEADVFEHHSSCFKEGNACDSCWFGLFGKKEMPSNKSLSAAVPNKRKRTQSSRTPSSDDDLELSKDMNALSVKEREDVFDEIHGVAKITIENPAFLEQKYLELDNELQGMHKSRRKAYNRAVFLKPSLEHDRTFQLMFLRADRFDVKLAAKRLVHFFESKLELFGDEKLAKVITLEDLSVEKDDIEAVQLGFSFILPEKDRAGRSIIFFPPCNFEGKNWKSCARNYWYQLMVHLREDVNSQVHGFVGLSYSLEMPFIEKFALQYTAKSTPLVMALPTRTCCVHVCTDDLRFKSVFQLGQMLVSKEIRMRFRYHFGSPTEVIYNLMTFGIPMSAFPVKIDGSVSLDCYFRYLQDRNRIEKEAATKRSERLKEENVLEYPNHHRDVLIGRGKSYHGFPGNDTLCEIAQQYLEQYEGTKEHLGKMCVLMAIAFKINEAGGNFLHRTQNGWEIATEKMVQEKVRSTLRKLANDNKNEPSGEENSSESISKRPRLSQG